MCEQVEKKILFEQGFYIENGIIKNAGMCPDDFAETFVFVELRSYDGIYRILNTVYRKTTDDGLCSEKELLTTRFNDADAIRTAIEKLDAMKKHILI